MSLKEIRDLVAKNGRIVTKEQVQQLLPHLALTVEARKGLRRNSSAKGRTE